MEVSESILPRAWTVLFLRKNFHDLFYGVFSRRARSQGFDRPGRRCMTMHAALGNYLAFSRGRAAYSSALMAISEANDDAIRPTELAGATETGSLPGSLASPALASRAIEQRHGAGSARERQGPAQRRVGADQLMRPPPSSCSRRVN